MKGDTVIVNGERWTVVDVAPAAPLAEMVAAILEEEGFLVMTRGPDSLTDVFSHLGAHSLGITYTLVPEAEGERALDLLADTVTDFEGDELEALIAQMEAQGLTLEDLAAEVGAERGAGADEAGGDEPDDR